mmetsp:Transcript_36099/g.64569  ORF Transcript_36099/g.64569 Transcript_36099/m.64569 type:complete len:320 (-) Transcript_36099:1431-2390(-)
MYAMSMIKSSAPRFESRDDVGFLHMYTLGLHDETSAEEGSNGPASSAGSDEVPCLQHVAEIPAKPEPKDVAVCLDYLLGMCQHSRYHCKFLHVKALEYHPLNGRKICQAYALTRHCKFGRICNDYHPTKSDPYFRSQKKYTHPKDPKHLKKMRKLAEKEKEKEKTKADDQSSKKNRGSAAQGSDKVIEASVRQVNAILNRLQSSNEDVLFKDLIVVIAANPKLTLRHILSLVFFRAMDMDKETCESYGLLCKRLFTAMENHDLVDIAVDIMSRVMNLTSMLPDDASEQLQSTIKEKQSRCMVLMKALLSAERSSMAAFL